MFWAEQPGEIDPKLALDAHLALNTRRPNDVLFSYPHRKTRARRPLTKHVFLKRVAMALRQVYTAPTSFQGSQADWALGDSFQKYLRKHEQILAPHMQAKPQVQEAFTRCTTVSLPPVR